MFGEVKYTYVAWHMCNFCSRAYKDIDKLLDHKFENHHDQFMGSESTPFIGTRTLNLPKKKLGLGRKRIAEATPENIEENENIICGTSKFGHDAKDETLTITETFKPIARISDSSRRAEELDDQVCKKKPRESSPPSEDDNEDKEVPQGYKLRHKSSTVKQDQNDLYLACSHCKETFSTLEGLRSHESWEMSRKKSKTTSLGSDKSEDDDKSPAQSSAESSREISPMTTANPRQRAKKTSIKVEQPKRKASSATTTKNEPATKRDYSLLIPRKFEKTTQREQRSRTPMHPSQVNRAQELSPRPAKMRASIEPPKTIRCAYCWQKFEEEEYGEHRKICSRRLRNSFTARKSTSNIDLAATVEQLTQQVEEINAGGVQQVEEEM